MRKLLVLTSRYLSQSLPRLNHNTRTIARTREIIQVQRVSTGPAGRLPSARPASTGRDMLIRPGIFVEAHLQGGHAAGENACHSKMRALANDLSLHFPRHTRFVYGAHRWNLCPRTLQALIRAGCAPHVPTNIKHVCVVKAA